ncbi:FAD-dependent monooxygenase [Curtobacterium sp. ISL-83]|uniref:FAD-dependent monooxygenase n=1 Tax=Curtobacterium sp. ISL-83 TaxID=2819145 RepID=UPI001BE9F134|nr:FAD-dependent monooxygenase [Curtobacterium sp. ISL-83]MBT2501705.1 FAD-dependent monooxygenase [Curtobacterium sp. ISL-83]
MISHQPTPSSFTPVHRSQLQAVIVGGSLAGLVSALALARQDIGVTVLERSNPTPRLGGGLGVDGALLARVTGVTRFVGNSPLSAIAAPWTAVREALREAAESDPRIELHHDLHVSNVGQDAQHAWAESEDGRRFAGDLLLGADGHRSLLRQHVAPERPNADYAGYVIWLGMVDEADLPDHGNRPTSWDMLDADGDILFGIPVPGPDASTDPGRGRIGWAWYDARRNDLLRQTGAVVDGVVQHSVRARDLPDETLAELANEASRWPQPWRDAILQSIAQRDVLGTPIAEYVPVRLISGRFALVGNAAHVPTPMTGQGFDASVLDAEALGRELRHAGRDDVPSRLQRYERVRLDDVQRLVRGGQRFSRAFAG